MNDLIPFNDLKSMSLAIAAGKLFPALKDENQVLTLLMLAQAEGLHPINALRQFHIIDGKPSMRADAILAKFRQKGGSVVWKTKANDIQAQVGEWSFEGQTVEIGFGFAEAQAAGYVKPNSGWMKDPAAMMRARAISRAVRMLAPEVVVGIYTPEEVSDMDDVARAKGGKVAPEVVQATVVEDAPAVAAGASAAKAEPKAQAEELTPSVIPSKESEPTDPADRMKFLRGKLNQALLKITKDSASPGKEFVAIRKEFESTHGKEFVNEATGHKPGETFISLLTEHWQRIEPIVRNGKWRTDLGTSFTEADFRKHEKAFLDGEVDQSEENEKALNAKGRALKLADYIGGEASPSAEAAAQDDAGDLNAQVEG
jgi:hypothetical protein